MTKHAELRPMRRLVQILEGDANTKPPTLFRTTGLWHLFPEQSEASHRSLISRAKEFGFISQVCRGFLKNELSDADERWYLFHLADLLRPHCFNYVSLESALAIHDDTETSFNKTVSFITTGRSNRIRCNSLGTLEFVHSSTPIELQRQGLEYDEIRKAWIASRDIALGDMVRHRRNLSG